jgi:hypothetical protein
MSKSRSFDSADMAARGRIGAHSLHARHDTAALTARAREGLEAKWLREVDPSGELPFEERARRAAHLRSAHYHRMARASAIARQKRAPVAEAA